MGTMLARLWTDEDAFLRFGRAVVFSLAALLQSGVIPAGKVGWWAAPVLQFFVLCYGSKPGRA